MSLTSKVAHLVLSMDGSLDAGLKLVLTDEVPNAQFARRALEASRIRTTRVVLSMRVADGDEFAQTVLSLVPAATFADRERAAAGSALRKVWEALRVQSETAGRVAMRETRFFGRLRSGSTFAGPSGPGQVDSTGSGFPR